MMETQQTSEQNSIRNSDMIRFNVNFKDLSNAPSKTVIPLVNDLTLKQEILYGNPAAFIISGYRGAGKTSFIHNLEAIVKEENKNIIFVKCNVSKEETKTNLLRKLTRGLLGEVQEQKTTKKTLKKFRNRKLKLELDLLYKRTFHDVNEITKNTNEIIKNRQVRLNLIVLLITLVPVIAYIFNQEFIDIFKETFSVDLKGVIGTSTLMVLLSYVFVRRKINKDLNEIEFKTLYDDEIAEIKLIESIDKLKDLGIKPIFVIDELDKIDVEDQLEKLIGELKPIILYGNATFILVTGQKLYYQLEKSKYLDDAILPNMFMHPYHVPLLDRTDFKKLFEKIVVNERENYNSIYNDYLSSLILKSNRSPRKFINLIRNELIWEADKAFIKIPKFHIKTYQTYSKILDSLDSLLKRENITYYSLAQQDFIITQLHICINKIVNKGIGYFEKTDILQIDDETKKKYPDGYWERVENLAELLIGEFDKAEILEFNTESQQYTLKQYKDQLNQADLEILIRQFMGDFQKFEYFISGIYEEIFRDSNKKQLTVKRMVMELVKKNVVKNNEKLNRILELRNQVAHRSVEVGHQINDIREAQRDISFIRMALISDLTYYVIKTMLETKGYEVTSVSDTGDDGYDIIAIHANPEISNFIFDIRVINKVSSGLGSRYLQLNFAVEGLKVKYDSKFKAVSILYCLNSDQQLELDLRIKNETEAGIQGNLVTLYPFLYRLHDNQTLQEYIMEIL
jgi:hypothetical protein